MSGPGDDFLEALQWHRQGRLIEAETRYRQILADNPDHVRALQHLAAIFESRGWMAKAAEFFARAAALAPGDPVIGYQLANARTQLGDFAGALAAYDAALILRSDLPLLHFGRGCALQGLGRFVEALAAFDRAVALKPNDALGHAHRAAALQALGLHRDALAAIDRALSLNSADANAHLRRGVLLLLLAEPGKALASLERAAGALPDHLEAQFRLGDAQTLTGDHAAAVPSYGRALALDPDHAGALTGRAAALIGLRRFDEAAADLEKVLARDPEYAVAWLIRARLARAEGRLDDAEADEDRALSIAPVLTDPLGETFLRAAMACDWPAREHARTELIAAAEAGENVYPFLLLYAADDPALHQRAAIRRAGIAKAPRPPWKGHERLRIAYLSADFRDHPVAWQIAEVLERHDRSAFEIFAVSLCAAPPSPIGKRVRGAVDHFLEAERLADPELAALLAENEIDIAVDLTGFTTNGRLKAFRHRPVPVVVNWLGYPGTLGADYVDYILADAVTIPPGAEAHYCEKVVRLPGCYMPRDTTVAPSPPPSRADAGLPPDGIVFCAFHSPYKIDAAIFAVWMGLLREVPASVLWLNLSGETARHHLTAAARAAGVAPQRLIFAPRIEDRAAHLGRLGLADLFLDTPAYNGHATVSDMLWAGVAVVALAGKSFAARVSAAMLQAAGLGDLVAADLPDYGALARALAGDPARRAAIRADLAAKPPSDCVDFTRGLEAAYRRIAEIAAKRQNPQGFSVTITSR
jgi:protein O-GlcNAc transferase